MTPTTLGAAARQLSAAGMPAALLGLGLSATFLLVSRLSHRCAGAVSVLVALTVPLCYARAPSTAAAAAISTSVALPAMGFGLAALGSESRRVRRGATALGLAGLGLAGLGPGVWVGVSVAAASVAATWALARRPRAGRSAALLAVAAALAAPCVDRMAFPGSDGGVAFSMAPRWLQADAHPTFDRVVAELGRGLFPWSALLPFAWAAMTERPARVSEGESALRLLSLSGLLLSAAASALSVGAQRERFAGLTFVSSALGLWFWDVQRGARVSRSLALALALLLVVLGLDFLRLEDVWAQTFAPGATAAQRREHDAAAPVLLVTCMALGVGGAALGCRRRAPVRTGRARWPRLAMFAGTLLGALVLRVGHCTRPQVPPPSAAALGTLEQQARAAPTSSPPIPPPEPPPKRGEGPRLRR